MTRVMGGIIEHVRRERSHAPVGALMLLVQLQPEELLEQCGEPKCADAEQLCCHAGVEEIRDAPAVVLVQEAQVVVRVVQHHFDRAIFQHRSELYRCADGQRVDDGFV